MANLDYTEPHTDPGSDSDSFKDAYDTDESDITAPSYSIITNTGDLSNQEISGSELGNLSDTEHNDGDDESNMSLQLVNHHLMEFFYSETCVWDIMLCGHCYNTYISIGSSLPAIIKYRSVF